MTDDESTIGSDDISSKVEEAEDRGLEIGLEEKKEEAESEPGSEERLEAPDKKEDVDEKEEAEKKVEEEEVEEEAPRRRIIVLDSREKTLDNAIGALRKGEYSVIGVETTEEFLDVTKWRSREGKEDKEEKAITPEEYWEIAKGNVPDLLIMDLDIKDLDGWEFIYRLKFDHRYYEYKGMPIIVRTDLPVTVETVKKFQSESVYDYILKSLKGKELLQKIDQYFKTIEKLLEVKQDISREIGHVVASEYERIFLATRIRLKYLYALKGMVEELKKGGAGSHEIKNIEDLIYLKNRELIKQERRKREIKKRLKEKKKVKDVDRGEGEERGAEAITD